MWLLLSLLVAVIGPSLAMVNFSNSMLIDRYDVNRYQLPIPKCSNGCVVYASTREAAPPNTGTPTYSSFAKDLYIYDNARSVNLISVLDVAKLRDGRKKIPYVINGPADISIVNRNSNRSGGDAYSFVLYIVEKAIADSISREVYDVMETEMAELKPQTAIVTLLSAQAYKLTVKSRTEADKIVVRLAGFDNAGDDNKDQCEIAYTTEGSEFDGFSLLPNTPILSLATVGRTQATLNLEWWNRTGTSASQLKYHNAPEGFITSPGWNGCRNPNSGGYQAFRTSEYLASDKFSLFTVPKYQDTINITVFPNLDSSHQVVIDDRSKTPIKVTGTTRQDYSIYLRKLNVRDNLKEGEARIKVRDSHHGKPPLKKQITVVAVSYENMQGDQGFLLRYKKFKAPITTTAIPTTKATTTPSTSATTLTTTITTVTEETPVHDVEENYCKCAIKDGWFDDWDPSEIWVDLVIIIDTSSSMGDKLDETLSTITSFVSLMSTDTSAEFYSRIGVIAASDKNEVIYNLNMTSSDNLEIIQQSNVAQIDIEAALQAALIMFSDGSSGSGYRPNAKQIVYYLTSSIPSATLNGADEFKAGGGIIMVNGFNIEGASRPSFTNLASPNFFFSDLTENYLNNLGVLCEANCFCDSSMQAFNDDQISQRTLANRGCFRGFNQGIPHQKARESCIKNGGALVSIHDSPKESFVYNVASSVGPNKKYWLGQEYDGKAWNWDDKVQFNTYDICKPELKSTNPYANWDVKQPNTNGGKMKCAYASQAAGKTVKWTAANCLMGGVIHVCESAPCSRGNKKC